MRRGREGERGLLGGVGSLGEMRGQSRVPGGVGEERAGELGSPCAAQTLLADGFPFFEDTHKILYLGRFFINFIEFEYLVGENICRIFLTNNS